MSTLDTQTNGPPPGPPPPPVSIDDLVEKAKKSLDDAQKQMDELKDKGGKFRKMASEHVNALLQPALHVRTLLEALSSIYPVIGIISKSLTIVIQLEMGRRRNDARILILFLKFSSALLSLSQLSPHFESGQALEGQLKDEASRIRKTLEEFGNFSDVYYNREFIYHIVHSKSEKDKLLELSVSIDMHKAELDSLVGHQTLNVASETQATVAQTSGNVDVLVKYFIMEATNDKEDQAREFLDANGGEEAVQNNPQLLAEFASKFNQNLTDKLRTSLKESLDDALSENWDLFDQRFRETQIHLASKFDRSRNMVVAEMIDRLAINHVYYGKKSERSRDESDDSEEEPEEDELSANDSDDLEDDGSQDEDGGSQEATDGAGSQGNEHDDEWSEDEDEGGVDEWLDADIDDTYESGAWDYYI